MKYVVRQDCSCLRGLILYSFELPFLIAMLAMVFLGLCAQRGRAALGPSSIGQHCFVGSAATTMMELLGCCLRV